MSDNGKKTILLVEDDAIIAISGKTSLESLGYNIVTANTGERAVERCRGGGSIDLVLMDIDLGPGIDGTEAARIILQDRDIPVVFLSSHAEPEIVEKTQKITSYGYVVKSSNIAVLDASIKMAFNLFCARKELIESEKKYRQLFENSNSAVALHEMIYNDSGEPVDYRYLAINPAFERVSELKAEQVVNRRALEVFPNIEKHWIAAYGKVAQTGTPAVWEDYAGAIDKHVEVAAFRPEENQLACVFTDVTERKQAEYSGENCCAP